MGQMVGQVYADERIDIDEHEWIDCTFLRCEIVFHGRRSHINGCDFGSECRWSFADEAATTIEYLADLWKNATDEMVLPIIAALVDDDATARSIVQLRGQPPGLTPKKGV